MSREVTIPEELNAWEVVKSLGISMAPGQVIRMTGWEGNVVEFRWSDGVADFVLKVTLCQPR